MKKHFIALAVALVLLCALLPRSAIRASAASYSGSCGTNLSWSLDTETGVLTISGSGAMRNYSSTNDAPWYQYRTSIKSLELPDGMTKIGNYAFYLCTNLKAVTIPDSVTQIGENAFAGCFALTSVDIPSSVEHIPFHAFSTCRSLTSITIPYGVTSIGQEAFSECSALTSISIPTSVTSIASWTFSKCTSLVSVEIPYGVTTIEWGTFQYCKNLSSVNIPDSVTSISDYAFDRCSSLASITIPTSVVNIGSFAFGNCSSLNQVTIPDSITSLSDGILYNCTSLTSVKMPANLTSIGGMAFENCSSLANITIPDRVTSIGGSAFGRCTSLTRVIIPYGVANIGGGAFSGCTSLSNIMIPSSVTAIGDSTFSGCTSLEGVTIPASVASIGQWAFGYNTGIIDYNFVITGWDDTAAEDYAIDNGFDFISLGPAPEQLVFSDIQYGAYYRNPVYWAVMYGITSGTSDTTFSPKDTCTRAQIVTFLWRAAGSPEPKTTNTSFEDVSSDKYYYKAVLWAAENNITSGTGDTTFSPKDGCTRAQVVSFLWRYAGSPTPETANNPFEDVEEGKYYYNAVLWAAENNITSGTSDTTFSPTNTCTRGQIVTFLYRYMVG